MVHVAHSFKMLIFVKQIALIFFCHLFVVRHTFSLSGAACVMQEFSLPFGPFLLAQLPVGKNYILIIQL